MKESPLDVLLVEADPLEARLVGAALRRADEVPIALEHVESLAAALARLAERQFDAILLDLFLPDARGVEALRQVLARAPQVAVVVLTARDDKSAALRAVREGAQDYLIKGRIEREVLQRAIGYAIERHRLVTEVRSLSLRDELTGLHNGRGFFELADQHLKLSARTGEHNALVFIRLDDTKRITDEFGHHEGDRALRAVAGLLRSTFRCTDLMARVRGDEFVALLLHVDPERAGSALCRLQAAVKALNAEPGRAYPLSLNVELVHCGPTESALLDELLLRAGGSLSGHEGSRNATRVETTV